MRHGSLPPRAISPAGRQGQEAVRARENPRIERKTSCFGPLAQPAPRPASAHFQNAQGNRCNIRANSLSEFGRTAFANA
ncbi:MAG: hypothetical protein OXU61_04255 [Gammaproteobacteria bacterium]|nr:hypothetical protein [Gammaproteobacteria bacterium]